MFEPVKSDLGEHETLNIPTKILQSFRISLFEIQFMFHL